MTLNGGSPLHSYLANKLLFDLTMRLLSVAGWFNGYRFHWQMVVLNMLTLGHSLRRLTLFNCEDFLKLKPTFFCFVQLGCERFQFMMKTQCFGGIGCR